MLAHSIFRERSFAARAFGLSKAKASKRNFFYLPMNLIRLANTIVWGRDLPSGNWLTASSVLESQQNTRNESCTKIPEEKAMND